MALKHAKTHTRAMDLCVEVSNVQISKSFHLFRVEVQMCAASLGLVLAREISHIASCIGFHFCGAPKRF